MAGVELHRGFQLRYFQKSRPEVFRPPAALQLVEGVNRRQDRLHDLRARFPLREQHPAQQARLPFHLGRLAPAALPDQAVQAAKFPVNPAFRRAFWAPAH